MSTRETWQAARNKGWRDDDRWFGWKRTGETRIIQECGVYANGEEYTWYYPEELEKLMLFGLSVLGRRICMRGAGYHRVYVGSPQKPELVRRAIVDELKRREALRQHKYVTKRAVTVDDPFKVDVGIQAARAPLGFSNKDIEINEQFRRLDLVPRRSNESFRHTIPVAAVNELLHAMGYGNVEVIGEHDFTQHWNKETYVGELDKFVIANYGKKIVLQCHGESFVNGGKIRAIVSDLPMTDKMPDMIKFKEDGARTLNSPRKVEFEMERYEVDMGNGTKVVTDTVRKIVK